MKRKKRMNDEDRKYLQNKSIYGNEIEILKKEVRKAEIARKKQSRELNTSWGRRQALFFGGAKMRILESMKKEARKKNIASGERGGVASSPFVNALWGNVLRKS